jgi:hypothetical protein
MDYDEDERNVKPQDTLDPQDIERDLPGEGEVVAPDAGISSDQSAESRVSPAAPTQRETERSSKGFPGAEMPGAPEEIAASNARAATQSAGQVTRIELPADLEISPTTQPPEATGDRHSRLLRLDRGEESEGDPDPVDQILRPASRRPLDSSGSARTPESAMKDESPESLGETMPRVQVFVTLLESQTMYAEAIEKAVEKHAPKYRQIAESEVERGFRHYENQRRAADWQLRGP